MLSTLKSEIEVRQRRAYLMWFSEFNGELALADIDSDLKKELRRATIKKTIEALKAAGDDYVWLSQEQ